MHQIRFKACSGLVLAFCCYAALGCGEDNAGNKSAEAAGGSAGNGGSGGANASKGGSKSDAGAASGGAKGGNASNGGTDPGGAGPSDGGESTNGGTSAAGTAGQSGGGGASGGGGTAEMPVPSAGCSVQSKPATGKQTLDVNGTQRTYYLIASKVADPVPLYLGFHGHSGNGEADQNTFNLQSRAGGKGVFMFPDGVVQSWFQNALGWDNRNNDNPDMHFVQKLIDEAKAKHCVDTSRIYVMGFSWGGWMATQVACAFGNQLRAFASGGGGGPMNKTNCQRAAGLIMHGTNDASEGIGSGRTSRDNFLQFNKCQSTSTPVADNHCVSYAGCELPLWWCEHSGGHEVPAGWGSDAVWNFFQSAPRR